MATEDYLAPGARVAFDKAIQQYQPGGGYGKGVETALQRGETKAVAGGMQQMVSAGLGGTSMPAGIASKYEEEVATPARAKMESGRAQALAAIYQQMGMAESDAMNAANQIEQQIAERISRSRLQERGFAHERSMAATRTATSLRQPRYSAPPRPRATQPRVQQTEQIQTQQKTAPSLFGAQDISPAWAEFDGERWQDSPTGFKMVSQAKPEPAPTSFDAQNFWESTGAGPVSTGYAKELTTKLNQSLGIGKFKPAYAY